MNYQHYLAAGLCGFVLLSGFADTAEKNKKAAVALTDAGKVLEAKYLAMQQSPQGRNRGGATQT